MPFSIGGNSTDFVQSMPRLPYSSSWMMNIDATPTAVMPAVAGYFLPGTYCQPPSGCWAAVQAFSHSCQNDAGTSCPDCAADHMPRTAYCARLRLYAVLLGLSL